eukprot:TRINITY_DN9810_c0_g1_i1.p1 TRINITY_DN9810_c0_g1~~TRINITY_DN9810_c0_g1_i1.p1  ORF type:complete len:341 (+),score=99.82 TRINITY_DN9810_c0_g1_i1:35-1057(+)
MALNIFAPLEDNSKQGVLVEFKAGKMHMGQDGLVRPDRRRGLVQLKQTSDQLMHFIWSDRTTGQEETNLIIIGDDAKMRLVREANARVYVLQFRSSENKHFFWMQEPTDENDRENVDKLNEFIANPPSPEQASAGRGDVNSQLGNLNQAQLMQLLAQASRSGRLPPQMLQDPAFMQQMAAATGGNSPVADPNQERSPVPTQSPRPAPQAGNLQVGDLSRILSSMQGTEQRDRGPSLRDVLNPSEIPEEFYQDDSIVERLAEFLPEGSDTTPETLKENISSAQFRGALGIFEAALRTGDLSGVISSMGLNPGVCGPNSTIEEFLEELQRVISERQDNMDVE